MPLIDTRNVDMNAYHNDLRDCQQYAQGENVGGQAAVGAIAGALFGTVLAKAAGSSYDSGAMARVGAVTGTVAGAGHGAQTQVEIVKNCMRGRGDNVLR